MYLNVSIPKVNIYTFKRVISQKVGNMGNDMEEHIHNADWEKDCFKAQNLSVYTKITLPQCEWPIPDNCVKCRCEKYMKVVVFVVMFIVLDIS